MVLQTAATTATGVLAMGLDVGGPALEVAQRGFRSMLSNRMAQLGQWRVGGDRPEIQLADDLVDHLVQRERADGDTVVIGVAAPSWFGAAERHRLAEAIDPTHTRSLVACSTPLAAAIGASLAGPDPFAPEVVLAIDLDLGCSASVVEFAPGVVRECCTVGLSLRQLRAESAGAGIVPGTRQRTRALAVLASEAARAGLDVTRVVAVGDDSVDAVRAMLVEAHAPWGACAVTVLDTRAAVARGAAFVADPDAVAMAPDGGRQVVSCLGRTLGVLTEQHDQPGEAEHGESPETAVIHPVVERGVPLPVVREQPFDLGPDDGLDVYLDLYEQRPLGSSTAPAEHRVVATARHRHEARRGEQVTVVFAVDRDGRVRIGPDDEWVTDWRDAEVGIHRVPRAQVETAPGPGRPRDARASRSNGAVVRALQPGRPADHGARVGEDADVGEDEVRPADDEVRPADDEVRPADDEVRPADDEVRPADDDVASAERTEDARPVAPQHSTAAVRGPEPWPATSALVGALQRCERLLSHEVGRMLALRSAFALLACEDGAAADELLAAADRLEAALVGRDDELAEALREAVAAVRDESHRGGDAWYFGGTALDVEHELGRVVEHLVVVVGFVSAAEQRRLVLDAMLLGLAPGPARAAVRRLVAAAQADRVDAATGDLDDRSRTVRLRPGLGRFVLDDPVRPLAITADGTQVGPSMRVLLDLR